MAKRFRPRRPAYSTMLQAAIPSGRGPAKHIEHDDGTSFTRIVDGSVRQIHTSQEPFCRVHETLHARHTDHKAYDEETYMPEVVQVIEDCRLHVKHWPWQKGDTPPAISASAASTITDFLSAPLLMEDRKYAAFQRFARQLTAMAMQKHLGPLDNVPPIVLSRAMQGSANQILKYLEQGKPEHAASWLQSLFFQQEQGDEGCGEGDDDEDGEEVESSAKDKSGRERDLQKIEEEIDGVKQPEMKIVVLPCTQPISHASAGFNLATSGSRIYRPALRRPILPQRIFWKRTPIEDQGAILFDASGSMHVHEDKLLDCCLRAPRAVIAYYWGSDGHGNRRRGYGELHVFAQDGMRAAAIGNIEDTDNTVDGPALDWLMQQETPRIFVTDRQFCGARDSALHAARLEILESLGEVMVYESYDEFQEDFPAEQIQV